MQEVTREQYLYNISDYEKLYLISINNRKVYLNADIEYGGEFLLRIEMMCFEMNSNLSFSEACISCRTKYAGGICFIEYNSYIEAESNILSDFIDLEGNAIYLLCEDTELSLVIKTYPNSVIYIRTL